MLVVFKIGLLSENKYSWLQIAINAILNTHLHTPE